MSTKRKQRKQLNSKMDWNHEAKPSKSYLEYVAMVNTYSEFVVAYNKAGPKARKRFDLDERIRILAKALKK
jgi:1,4-alpha-glucan branching enzyme